MPIKQQIQYLFLFFLAFFLFLVYIPLIQLERLSIPNLFLIISYTFLRSSPGFVVLPTQNMSVTKKKKNSTIEDHLFQRLNCAVRDHKTLVWHVIRLLQAYPVMILNAVPCNLKKAAVSRNRILQPSHDRSEPRDKMSIKRIL